MEPEHLQLSKDSDTPDANLVAPQPKAIGAKGVLAYIAIFATLAVSFDYVATYGADVKTMIECPEIQGGYNCQVSLVSGSVPAISVCWELNSICLNGIRSSAKKCFRGHMEKGAPVRLLIANSDFRNHDQCDHISATAVENVEVGVSNGIVTKGPFQ